MLSYVLPLTLLGSFWDQPLLYEDNAALFEMEEKDLMRDLRDLPRNSAIRKINELVKRVRLAKVHAYIIGHLKEQMPMLLGQAKKQQQLIADMGGVFRTVMKKYNLAPGDFPDLADFLSKISEMDFTKFHSLRQKVIDDAESVLGADIPRLMEALPRAMGGDSWEASHSTVEPSPIGYTVPPAEANPWASEEELTSDWMLAPEISKFKPQFESNQVGGFVSGKAAKDILMASGLSVAILRKIWDLSDVDKDGKLDLHEFVIASHLAELAGLGQPLPDTLSPELLPPAK